MRTLGRHEAEDRSQPSSPLNQVDRWAQLRLLALVSSAYLGLSVLVYIRAWAGGATDRLQIDSGDLTTYIWGLRWAPYAVAHGQNPFFTDWLNHPDGVNLLNNTGPILLGLLAAPVTLVFGAVAAYNVLQTLALAASATAMYVLLRRWTTWWPAAFVGGLLYGFSPYMIASGWSHLPLMFAPVPPLIVLCMDEVLVRQTGSARRWGVTLGLLVTAQFFFSAEMLADTAQACIIATLLLAALYRHQIRSRLRYAATGLMTAVSLAGVLLAYPIWFALFGPQHARIDDLPATLFSGDLVGPVVPTSNQVLSPTRWQELGDRLDGYVIEYMGRSYALTARGYLGVPLVLFLVFVVIRHRRLALVRLFALMIVIMFVASLGPRLKIATHITDIRLPAGILSRLPVLEGTSPDRYALLVALGATVLLAIGLDRARDDWGPPRRSARANAGLVAALAAACLIPLVPVPYSMMKAERPEYFKNEVKSSVPAGSVLLSYPFPGPLTAETMEWQANADMHYRMVGGYQFVPDGEVGATLIGNAGATQDLLSRMHRGQPVPALTPTLRQAILDELQRWRVQTVVVVLSAPGSTSAVRVFTDVLGRPPQHEADVAVWYRLPSGASSS